MNSGVLTEEAVRFLAGQQGADLLAEAAELPPDELVRLDRLRRRWPPELAAAAVETLDLRKRGRRKFADADRMFFTREALEQATSEAVARYRAAQFPEGGLVLDACCGIGGDAVALVRRGPVLAVDCNPAVVACAAANARLHPETAGLRLICADVTHLDLQCLRDAGVTAAFVDPSRRLDSVSGARRRARNSSEYSPPLAWIRALCTAFPSAGLKLSPAIATDELASVGGQVEFLSERGECKETAVWFGGAAAHLGGESGAACATVLTPNAPAVTLRGTGAGLPTAADPDAWLYEPDPAAIRAGLIAEVAEPLGAWPIHSAIAYLTGPVQIPTAFATAYRVLDWMPYNPKNLLHWLRRAGRRVEVVKRRGVPFEPEDVRRRLNERALTGLPSIVLVLTRARDERVIAILCDPPTNSHLS